MRTITVDQPLLLANDILGEAPVWVRQLVSSLIQDVRRQRLYWVDIDGCRVHWYEPETGSGSLRAFDVKVSAIACTENDDGLVAAIVDGFAFIPFSTLFSGAVEVAGVQVLQKVPLDPSEKRFNEGMVDPAGRFLAGTMGRAHGTHDGKLFALARGVVSGPVLEGITCTNGMGWIDNGNTMFFTDSWEKRIDEYDYDLGGVWSARWGAGKVIRISPRGDVDVILDFPSAWNMTSCVFGGPNMDELYVTSAGDVEDDAPEGREQGGSLFVIRNLGFSGSERHRYRA